MLQWVAHKIPLVYAVAEASTAVQFDLTAKT